MISKLGKGLTKIVSVGAIGTMTVGMLAGCGQTDTDTSISDIRSRGSLRVAILSTDTNMNYYDEDAGDQRGVEAEVVDIIAQNLGVTVDYIPVSQDELVSTVSVGTADIAIGCIDQDSTDISSMGSTTSYGGEQLYVITPKGIYAGDLTVFDGSQVGASILIDSCELDEVYSNGAEGITEYSSDDAITALENQNIKGYICNRSEAEYILSNSEDFQVQSCSDIGEADYVIITQSGYTSFIAGCNSLIEQYLNGEAVASWNQEVVVSADEVEGTSLYGVETEDDTEGSTEYVSGNGAE